MDTIISVLIFGLSLVTTVCAQSTLQSLLGQKGVRPPSENSSKPLDVKLGMYIESLGNFRSTEMSFDVDVYMYMSWQDRRLAHNYSDYVLINDDNIRRQIWLPDLYFSNAREAAFQYVTIPNFSIFIAPNGQISYSLRCTLTVACSLDLMLYPMDYQLCSIRVLSYAHIENQVNVTWFDDSPINRNGEIGLPEFEIKAFTPGFCNGTYRYAQMPSSYKYDNFSCLSGDLFLARSIGYNLVQSYIPTGLIVMISWVSFWIDRRAVPARVTLSFTTLVSLTTLGNGLRFGLPQVSYVKAIDLWFGSCMFFVFGALLEFAVVNSYMRKTEKFDQMAKKIISQGHLGRRAAIYDNLAERPQPSDMPNVRSPAMSEKRKSSSTQSRQNGLVTNKVGERLDKLINAAVGEKMKFADENYDHSPLYNGNGKKGGTHIDPAQVSLYDNVTPWCNLRVDLENEKKESDIGESDFLNESVVQDRSNDDDFRKKIRWRQVAFLTRDARAHAQTIENRLAAEFAVRDDETHWAVSRTVPKLVMDDVDKTTSHQPDRGTSLALTYQQISIAHSRHALRIDKSCRYGFPLTFIIWNLFYWWYYMIFQKAKIYDQIGYAD